MSTIRTRVLVPLMVLAPVALVGVAAWLSFDAIAYRDDPVAAPAAPGAPAVVAAGVGTSDLTAPNPPAYDALLSRGAEVYAANCFACHGGTGNGRGPLAANLSPQARDFTDRNWMASQSDGVLFTSVQRGVTGTSMPSFAGRLPQDDIWAVVAYVRGFSPGVRLDSAPDAVPAPADAGQGRELFQARCAGCHGADGHGDGPAAATLGTRPRDLADPGWLAGRSDEQLVGTLSAGLPGTAMPAFGDELTPQQSRAVVGYLRELAGADQRPNPLQGWAQRAFLAYCASCHGATGDGNGIAAGRLDPAPRDFRNPSWMSAQTEERLADTIRTGRPGTAMPPFAGLLNDDEIARLAEYVRAFAAPASVPGADSAYRYDPHALPGEASAPATEASAPPSSPRR
jgi:mono/diheme cytochrome c family protein